MLRIYGLFVAALLSVGAYAAEGDVQAIPALSSRVTDLTATLTPEQRGTLESELLALEQRKGSQLAVLIVPTTQPEDIAQYAIRVFDQWKLGRKGIDDGALLLVAKDDRRVRIEVARGLEAAIPDAATARIIREYISPRFRTNDYYGGIHDAVGALTGLVDGESLPTPWSGNREPEGDIGSAILFGLFAGFWARTMFGRASAVPRAGLVGVAAGGVGWLISGLIPLGIGLGVLGALFGLFGGGGGGFANRDGFGGWGGGGLGGGGFGGGSGGWGGGSGGGFSGGGGISAGGGSSGSW